ncbi:glyoxalase superfamily protein [Jeotgalibacillus proteolyticus]|uniref:Bleomycin resistance protein n=1 Tax=Jeotgalibacillus proteolyticus TaxID=2082395 RepID=A0A2S5G933_9BACL|nr:glyoxalase superfamily protein [Jeotgalibacillus proteolyticus]PPA69517.1 glyoxalase/bleomycin resistance/extradiol dioxygenase family protein [Jeotgalibacillus proteolyticus]
MSTSISMKRPIPVLRIFDEEKAREFYIDFLEFKVDWEHRFEEDLPLYIQISSSDCILHLSENYGDAIPGTSLRIEVGNVELLHEKLLGKKYKFARPGLETTEWNTREVRIGDPFGNRIVFYEGVR